MTQLRLVDSIESIDHEQWESFVSKHPNGNIFQTREFYEVYDRTKGYDPLVLFVLNEENEILGLQLSVTIKLFNNFLLFSCLRMGRLGGC